MKSTVTGIISAALLAAALVGVAAPASAATWACTARDMRDAHFTGTASGPFSNAVKTRASDKAIAACRSDSIVKASCVIVNCTGG
jgi:hypothetical protein